jgi:hypothetical protein
MVMAAMLVWLSASACGRDTVAGQGDASVGVTSTPTVASETPAEPVVDTDFDGAGFGLSTTIDNEWSPFAPGTQFVYEGFVNEDHDRLRHRVVFTVTDLTKLIDGVRTVVIWDRDYTGGELVEGELAFFAQDDGGNVWLLGEYPEEYEEGEFAGAPDTWIAGLAEARAGIHMRSAPTVGTSSYLQGWAPDIDFADRAKVSLTDQRTCVPYRCYGRVLVTDEWNPDEPGAHQLKYYAPGVGNVRVGFAGAGEQQKETLVLVNVVHLSSDAVAEVRREALELESRAYRVSKEVYRLTAHAE